jgi:hypothetical protein
MSHLDHHEPDHEALDGPLKAFMLAHDEPEYTVALERVMPLAEIDEPAPQPAASPDAESVFASLTRTRVLQQDHRHLFLERHPRRTPPCGPTLSPAGSRTSWSRSAARRSGISPSMTAALGALEREAQEHADARNADWSTAAAALTDARGL